VRKIGIRIRLGKVTWRAQLNKNDFSVYKGRRRFFSVPKEKLYGVGRIGLKHLLINAGVPIAIVDDLVSIV